MRNRLLLVAVSALLCLDAYWINVLFGGFFGLDSTVAPIQAAVIAGAIVIVALLPHWKPTQIPLLLAKGVAADVMPLVAIISIGSVAFAGIGGVSSEGTIQFATTFGIVGLSVQGAIIVLVHMVERRSAWYTLLSSLVGGGAGLVAGLGVIAVIEFGSPFLEGAIAGPRLAASAALTASVAKVQACAFQYQLHDAAGGYPPTLAAMGPGGTRCVPEDLARGKVGRIRVTYAALNRDSRGVFTSFAVTASGAAGLEHGEQMVAYGDTSGLMRSGPPGTDPAGLPVQNGVMQPLSAVRACAEVYRQHHPDAGYPRTLTELTALRAELDPNAPERLVGCNFDMVPRQDPGILVGNYRLTYDGAGDGSPIRAYVIQVRPIHYGVDGVISYRAAHTGAVTATFEDRAALADDYALPQCNYDLADTCSPGPGGIPPLAASHTAAAVVRDRPFVVTVEDLRPPETRDAPYQTWFQCNYVGSPRAFVRPASKEYTLALSHTCVIAGNARTSGDRALVRSWVRDRAGNVLVLTDTVSLPSRYRAGQ